MRATRVLDVKQDPLPREVNTFRREMKSPAVRNIVPPRALGQTLHNFNRSRR